MSVRIPMHGPLPEALRDWCQWIYLHAELAFRTASKTGHPPLTPEGDEATWLDFCGLRERRLIEVAMWSGIWEPVEDDRQEVAAKRQADAIRLGRQVA